VTKFLTATAVALALAVLPLAASARTNVSIGVRIGTPVYGAPVYRGYDEGAIRAMLYQQGYSVDYIDRRGGAYFVRVGYGPEVYEGYIGCDDGRWIRRDRIAYRRWDRDDRRWDRDGRWR